jgi:type I restriction enzyme R subunit
MDHVAIEKLRKNKPLTTADLAELERMLVEGGLGGSDEVRRAAEESNGLGLFVRSLVGMDRSAAKDAMAAFLSGTSHSANQIEFVNLVVDHLTEHGVVTAERLSGPEAALYCPHALGRRCIEIGNVGSCPRPSTRGTNRPRALIG